MTSLVQYENWLWGFQMAWFWINLCLIVALALLSHEKGERSLDRHFVLAALFCLLASLSAAHGLLLWLAVLPSLWVRSWKSRKPLLPIVFWFGCFLGTTILYFFDYQKPRHNVDNSYILKAPMDGIKFFFAVLGRPLSSEPSNAIVWGILLSIASLVTISLFLRQRTHRDALAPWLSLMLFPLGFAAITTVGRASLGLPAALASRYTTVSLLLIVGLVYVAQHYVKTSGWKIRFGYRAVAAGIAVILITTSLSFWERGTVFRNERLLGKTCLSLVEYLEDSQSSCVQKVFPHVAAVKYWWSYRLDRLGFVERLNDVEFRDRPQPSCGSLNSSTSPQAVELSESDFVHMSGELHFENCSSVLPVVFLSRNDKQEMFAASIVRDFSDRSRKSQIWAAAFFSNDLQPGRNSIRAWVYDPESSAFLSLENSLELQVSATPLADGSP
ncbi:hypothetical protein [Baaleninema sp.]|uniref:hypothetical protein n=1 Tax=Baaleninema sp. TaxID=3101197 RepID=UPI003D022B25